MGVSKPMLSLEEMGVQYFARNFLVIFSFWYLWYVPIAVFRPSGLELTNPQKSLQLILMASSKVSPACCWWGSRQWGGRWRRRGGGCRRWAWTSGWPPFPATPSGPVPVELTTELSWSWRRERAATALLCLLLSFNSAPTSKEKVLGQKPKQFTQNRHFDKVGWE